MLQVFLTDFLRGPFVYLIDIYVVGTDEKYALLENVIETSSACRAIDMEARIVVTPTKAVNILRSKRD